MKMWTDINVIVMVPTLGDSIHLPIQPMDKSALWRKILRLLPLPNIAMNESN